MTTQTQGKGKKKNKDVVKLTLDEFNNIDAPHGHSVVSIKMTGLDWAETMADHDQRAEQQLIVPTAPRSQRGPNVDYDSLPSEPPFRVDLYNLPMSVEEKDICERFLQGLDVIRVDITKSFATVELSSRDHMYEALCKDGTSFKNRTINVVIYGQSPQNSYTDRYGGGGGRGGSSYNDRYDRDRDRPGYGGSRSGDRFGERSGGFNSRDRDNYSGFRSGFGGAPQRAGGGYSDRYQPRGGNFRDSGSLYGSGEPDADESTNWRANARPANRSPPPPAPSYNNGSRQVYTQPRSDSYYQQPPPSHQYQESYQQRYQPHNNSSYSNYNNQPNSRPLSSSSTEERPKLVLKPRKTPINTDDVSSVSRNVAIFGEAKPSSKPYQKMKEVEEKLKAVQISDRKEQGESSDQAEPQQEPEPQAEEQQQQQQQQSQPQQ